MTTNPSKAHRALDCASRGLVVAVLIVEIASAIIDIARFNSEIELRAFRLLVLSSPLVILLLRPAIARMCLSILTAWVIFLSVHAAESPLDTLFEGIDARFIATDFRNEVTYTVLRTGLDFVSALLLALLAVVLVLRWRVTLAVTRNLGKPPPADALTLLYVLLIAWLALLGPLLELRETIERFSSALIANKALMQVVLVASTLVLVLLRARIASLLCVSVILLPTILLLPNASALGWASITERLSESPPAAPEASFVPLLQQATILVVSLLLVHRHSPGIVLEARRIVRWTRHLVSICSRRLLNAAEKSLAIRFLDIVAKLAVLLAVTTWMMSQAERKANERTSLWQRIGNATGEEKRFWLERLVEARGNKCLYGAEFSRADLRGFDFSGADLRGARFDGANLNGANFHGACLSGASFVGALLRGARFNGVVAYCADFRGAELVEAKLERSWLGGSDFRAAILSGASLDRRTYLQQSRLDGALLLEASGVTPEKISKVGSWDEQTQWPEGFDSQVPELVREIDESQSCVVRVQRPRSFCEAAQCRNRE